MPTKLFKKRKGITATSNRVERSWQKKFAKLDNKPIKFPNGKPARSGK